MSQDLDEGGRLVAPPEESSTRAAGVASSEADGEEVALLPPEAAPEGAAGGGPPGVQTMPLWPQVLLFLSPLLLIGAILGLPYLVGNAALRPFGGESLRRLEQFRGEYRDRMLWGTYRPGLYLGIRTRQSKGLLGGLLWFDADKPLGDLRHLAEERDNLRKYGWEVHDGEAYGRQELHDGDLHLTTHWLKHFRDSGPGGDWALRLGVREDEGAAAARLSAEQERCEAPGGDATGTCESPVAPDRRASLIFYLGDEDVGMAWHSMNGEIVLELEGPREGGPSGAPHTLARGMTDPLGHWALTLSEDSGSQGPSKATKVHCMSAHTRHFHNVSTLLRGALAAEDPSLVQGSGRRRQRGGPRDPTPYLAGGPQEGASLAACQFTGHLPFSVDLVFTAGLEPPTNETSWWDRAASIGNIMRPGLYEPYMAHQVKEEAREVGEGAHTPAGRARRVASLSGEALSQKIRRREAAFNTRFEETFPELAGAKGVALPPGTVAAAKAALSNTLGGLGYFFGSSKVRVPRVLGGGDKVGETLPAPLFTAVPSRPFFPRGFMWDEGFHQLLVARWAPKVSRDVLGHWLDLLSSSGWIAREQILGEEARARVPEEFVTQLPAMANPPTLFLPLADMARRVSHAGAPGADGDGELAEEREFLRQAFPRLRQWLAWFLSTQAGEEEGTFRWRGRLPQDDAFALELNPKTFASGMDDFPRASHPSGAERHVDLLCWLAMAARAMATIASSLQLPEAAKYEGLADRLGAEPHLVRWHWSAAAQQFLDWGNHTEGVALQPMQIRDEQGNVRAIKMLRDVTSPPGPRFVPHFGYPSLFPLFMRLLPPSSPQLGALLGQLGDPAGLASPHGLRSLSRKSALFGARNTEHDPPYWRGSVWINMNYLALAALDNYRQVEGPYQALAGHVFEELRQRVLAGVVGQWEATGYLWENYDEASGAGRGSHPFTGWTALVVLIAGNQYFAV